MRTVLGLDFGTQGVKGMVVSQDGTILTMAFRHYSFSVNADGLMEENPDEWVKAADEVIRELKEKGSSVFDTIESVGLSGHMHGVVPIAADGKVLHPCILWCDTRSAKQTEQLHDMLADDVISRLENPFVTAYSAGKILWLKENCPQVWENTHVFLYCKDYIRYLMTGSVMTDFSDASGSLLYDFRENTWSKQALEAVGLHESQLPPIVPSTCQAGRVTSCGAKIFGLKEGLPVAVGAGDLAASLFGSGISLSNETLVNLGTAGQILALQPKGETRKKGGHLFKFLNDQTDMLLYSIPSAAYCARWYVEQICPFLLEESKRSGKSVFDLLHADAAKSPAGSRGLLFEPYLSGTGSPYFDDMMRGAIIGIDSAHDYRDMGRAILEGVTEELGAGKLSFTKAAEEYLHPGRSAQVSLNGIVLGVIGELHPDAAEAYELEGRVCVAELAISPLFMAAMARGNVRHDLPRYPASTRDIAVIGSVDIAAGVIERQIIESGGDILSSVKLFDLYDKAPIPQGQRSLAYALQFRADDRTLTDAEVDEVFNNIVKDLSEKFSYKLR